MIQAVFCLGFPVTHSSPTQDFDGNIHAEPASHAKYQEISPNIETNYQNVQAAARAKLLEDLKDPSKSDLQNILEKALRELRAARDEVDPVASENLQAAMIYRPSVDYSFETPPKVDSEPRERKLQGEEKNIPTSQPKLNEHVAIPLHYACQAKDSTKLTANRLAAPRKDAAKKRRWKRPKPSLGVQMMATHGYHWREQIRSTTHPMKKPTAKLMKAIVQHHQFERSDNDYPPDDTSKMIEILGLEGIEWSCAYDRLEEVGVRAFESLLIYLKTLG